MKHFHIQDKYVQPKVLEENKTSIEHIETIFSKKYEEKHNVIL